MQHKYDNRKAGNEGMLAEKIYQQSCGESYRLANKREDCDGTDFVHESKKVDVKARKKRLPPHWCWIEVSAAGKEIGSGWAFKDKCIAQMMVYSKTNLITDAFFGRYHTKDLIELLNEKVDYDAQVSFRELYKIYNRYNWDGQHRGATTCVTYQDLESLASFEKLPISKEYWPLLVTEYEYDGIA